MISNKISSLYPNKINISNDEQLPIPIEMCFFLEDGYRDPNKFNRYYFNFPQSWCTSNRGETIIGIRNIFMLARKRRLEYTIKVRKYLKSDYKKIAPIDKTNEDINAFDHTAYDNIPAERKSEIEVKVLTWMEATDDFREFGHVLYYYLQAAMDKCNVLTDELIKSDKDKYKDKPKFVEDPNNISTLLDVMADGYYDYDKKTYIEKISSHHNSDPESPYYIDMMIGFEHRYGDNFNKIDRKFDFEDLFNISAEKGANEYTKYQNKWLREITFYDVWDRHSCKIYSSIAESSNGYIGNTTIYFDPIKYFKLSSTDQGFWIEFYSGRHKDIPVKIPRSESFSIEMQLLPFNKLLYV